MDTPVRICGRTFTSALIQHLAEMIAAQPNIGRGILAKEVCRNLDWYSATGRPALSSARVALRKLEGLGHFRLRKVRPSIPHRLKPSGKKLPPVAGVPKRVDGIRGLSLHLISGQEDQLHGLWNDMIIQQHPCGDAPLVGTQLRYLIGSDHGWLGALGFGPAAFLLGARDQWIGWSTRARLEHLREVVCLSRLLIRQEVRCTNLVSKTWSMVVSRLGEDWYSRYGSRPLLVETFVDRTRFTGLSLLRPTGCAWVRARVKDVLVQARDPRHPRTSGFTLSIRMCVGSCRTSPPNRLRIARFRKASRLPTGAPGNWKVATSEIPDSTVVL